MDIWILEVDKTFEQQIIGVYSSEELAISAKKDYELQLKASGKHRILGSEIFYYTMKLDALPIL